MAIARRTAFAAREWPTISPTESPSTSSLAEVREAIDVLDLSAEPEAFDETIDSRGVPPVAQVPDEDDDELFPPGGGVSRWIGVGLLAVALGGGALWWVSQEDGANAPPTVDAAVVVTVVPDAAVPAKPAPAVDAAVVDAAAPAPDAAAQRLDTEPPKPTARRWRPRRTAR